ncbi:MAG TPA: transglycosylase SLT domain-containing protein [Pyrinomonadaceae bacterium]|nr:transglycosylase SLT domain-containing protein [Pyrinomonadaceae bacterium]
MKTNLFKVFSLTAIITFLSASFAFGQISTSSSGARGFEPDNAGEAKINQITADAGIHFKQGLLLLSDSRRPMAREEFDKAVEVFLMSNVNVSTNGKLNNCYNQMIETIYRIEFPSAQQPQIKSLAMNCGWNVDDQLANNVVKLTQSTPSNTATASNPSDLLKPGTVGNQVEYNQVGFSDQKFEPSPLDDLSKLELTKEDIALAETPEAKEIYERTVLAVNGGSLGMKFQMHPMVQQYIGYYQGRGRSTMEIGLARSGQFMRMVRRIFREEGIPENMAWLGQIESAWKPTARSWAAAAGLWQFIPGTGTRYGLRINGYVDERNSFEKATHASAQYLKFLANRYGGNWELAMAAYNSGEGNVDRAIRKAGVANFWVAYPYLPRETRNYVPNILAAILIANNPNAYGFSHVRPLPPLQYEQIRVPPSTSLSTIAQLSDTPVDYIRYLNPEFRSNMTPPEPYIVRVPTGKSNNVAAVLRKLPNAGKSTVAVSTVLQGETAQNVAIRNGVSVDQVQTVGGKAVVQQNPNNKVKQIVYSRPTNSQTVSPTTKGLQIVTVKAGDTIAKIAARFNVPAVEVARLNGLTSVDEQLAVGRQIRVQP